MPNSLDREAFEAAYRKIYPATYPTITPNAFERDHDGYYIRTPIQEAWAWWQAGAAAERQKINAEHASKVPHAEMEKLQSAVKVLRDRSAP